MLSKLLKKINPAYAAENVAAIYLGRNYLDLLSTKSAENTWHCSAVKRVHFEQPEWRSVLQTTCASLPKNAKVIIILSPARYHVIQTEKPALLQNEINQALPWQIKDLVNINVEDMVVDYIDIPVKPQQPERISVVVSSFIGLKELLTVVHQHKLTLCSIQPEEWLLPLRVQNNGHPSILVVHQPEQELLIQIVHNGQLFFSRRVRGFDRLCHHTEDELKQGVFDNLLLELQRSMDYFESQLKQPPVRDIVLSVTTEKLPVFKALFASNGFNNVSSLHLKPEYDWAAGQDLYDYWQVFAATAVLIDPVKPL